MDPRPILNRISGQAAPAAAGTTFECRDPADLRRVVATAPESGPEDIDAAVTAALEAQPTWASTPPSERAQILEAAASLLTGRADEIAAEMVSEMGKPLMAARGEVLRTADNLRLYAGEALRLQGRTFPIDAGTSAWTVLDPVGVVGVITPWNFPLSLAGRKIGPALAAGNAVVFKPSPKSPGSGDRLAAALEEAGLPRGTLQTVHGFGAGAHLVADPRVAAITFTGSTAVGERIHRALGLGRRAQLELGGNNPVVVLADADLDRAADIVARSAFSLSGQACTAAGRIIVDAAVHDELVARVAEAAERLVVGPGMRDGVDMGPLIDQASVAAMEAVVAQAVEAGAGVVTGGTRPGGDDFEHGAFYRPTLLTDVTTDMDVARHEVFGPVVGFERISGLDEAIEAANATEYGLTSAVCTRDLAAAHRFVAEVRSGIVRVNRPTVGTPLNAPFGGIKMSGTGTHKEQLGPTVMDFYIQSRTVFVGV